MYTFLNSSLYVPVFACITIAVDRGKRRTSQRRMCHAGFCTIQKNTRSYNECIFLPSVDRARTLQTTSFVSLCAEVGNCSRPIREFRSRLGAISLDTNAVASEIFLIPFLPYLNKTKTEGTNRTNERANEIHLRKKFLFFSCPSFASDGRIQDARFPFAITKRSVVPRNATN